MSITIAATPRTAFGRRANVALRAAERIPLTVSRSGEESVQLSVAVKDGAEILKHTGQVIGLDVAGTVCQVLVKGHQRHPIKDYVQQIDALEVCDDKLVKVQVLLHPLVDDCPGIRAGGLLESMLRKVEIRCPAQKIPTQLSVDLSQAEIGSSVYAGSVILPEGATLVTLPRVAVMTVIKTRGMRRAEAAGPAEKE